MMSLQKLPEVWLRGPIPDIPALLQPVAHTLLQAREEIEELMNNFPDEKLWARPANLASPAFHLQHIAGVIDRLYTYVQGDLLSQDQLTALKNEGQEQQQTVEQLVKALFEKIDWMIENLRNTDEKTLKEPRGVGRAQLPSTVQGLLFHIAEHTMRHVGQLLVTVRILKEPSLQQN